MKSSHACPLLLGAGRGVDLLKSLVWLPLWDMGHFPNKAYVIGRGRVPLNTKGVECWAVKSRTEAQGIHIKKHSGNC